MKSRLEVQSNRHTTRNMGSGCPDSLRWEYFPLLDRKALMGWVCLSVRQASTAALGKPFV